VSINLILLTFQGSTFAGSEDTTGAKPKTQNPKPKTLNPKY